MPEINAIKELTIHGFRGFSDEETITFAQPNGKPGSGLTILVGPNNSGKSTIAESVMAVTQIDSQKPTFSEGKRNTSAGSRVKISVSDKDGNTRTVETLPSGGSETRFVGDQTSPAGNEVFVLPSRRKFEPYFGKSDMARTKYVQNSQTLPNTREGQTAFSGRIFHINNDPVRRQAFEDILKQVLNPLPNWTIDQSEQGQYYLKYSNSGHTHSSDGLGDGLLSVFFIVDALYDSEAGSVVMIDEPELSLHPQLQAKVRDLLVQYSADRQIVVSTHAPKFIDWHAIVAGAQIARVINSDGATKIFELSEETRDKVRKLLGDMNNPHVLGLDANEVFFLSDRVVLVEGQEDVMFFPRVLADLNIEISADFYGWGVGGAHKMGTVASILKDLGFNKVVGILDGNLDDQVEPLQADFPEFLFLAHDADDVRYKKSKPELTSLLTEDGKRVREEFKESTVEMFRKAEVYLVTD